MKKPLLTLFFIACMSLHVSFAENPKHEFRATWLATVANIDWPETKATDATTRNQQKKELTDIFDKMVAGNMNAVCMQVRSMCDAMYQSSYEPWSVALTGTRGKDPGYDPLAFAIEEAHKRGLELHIWVNPFRVTSEGTISTDDLIWKNAGQWIIKYNNGSFSGQIIDPGYPEAREYVIKVLMEIVNNYDVDGIVMDDYFYPYGGTTTEDADSKSKYKPNNVVDVNQDGRTDDDWRRSNVDACLKALYDTIQSVKPWVRFGMGSFGIWSTQRKAAQAYGLTLPSGISGLDDYDVQACNPVEWVKNGYVDYINPQLYWSTNIAAQDYDVLCKWWAKDVCEHFSNQLPDGKKVHFFISQAAYHAYDGYKGYDAGVGEIQKQIDANRANLSSGYTGSVFYNTTSYLKMYADLAASHFKHTALAPPMDWKSKTALSAPTNLTISGTTLTWEHATAERFTVYVYPKSISLETAKTNPNYLKGIVYSNSYSASGIDLNNYNVAVYSYDRFGVEHAAAVYGDNNSDDDDEDEDIERPETNTSQITWELNGGEVNTDIVDVPTSATLTETFKNDYNIFFNASVETTRDISNFLYYGSIEKGGSNLVYEILNSSGSKWNWLRDYIIEKSSSNHTIQSALQAGTDVNWRYSLTSFFTANLSDPEYSVDFKSYGQPVSWKHAYQISVLLPSGVTSTYTLPIPTHPQGNTFYGWYDNPKGAGSAITAIPACWTGTLYAIWHEPIITWELNGGYVREELTENHVATPNNKQLFKNFMLDYETYYSQSNNTTIHVDTSLWSVEKGNVANFFYRYKSQNNIDVSIMLSDVYSGWTWLGNYLQEVNGAPLSAEVNWRYSLSAFFMCGPATDYCVNFSIAGQPDAWGDAFQASTQWRAIKLPLKIIDEPYTIPTPVRDGYAFVGWFEDANGVGTPITVLPIGYIGTLYAIWEVKSDVTTTIENTSLQSTMPMYDLLGRPVGQNYKGVVIQNGKKYLLK